MSFGLVIKETLKDLNCSWRWVSSSQLADGLTKVRVRQAFAERYKGHYIQLVADETYQAPGGQEEKPGRAKEDSSETRMTSSRVAETLIGMVMATQTNGAEGSEDKCRANGTQCKTDLDHVTLNIELFDMGMMMMLAMVTIILIGVAWLFCKSGNKKKSGDGEDSEEEPVPELEPLDYGEENGVMGNIVNDLAAIHPEEGQARDGSHTLPPCRRKFSRRPQDPAFMCGSTVDTWASAESGGAFARASNT